MIRAGTLDRRITIQTVTEGRDAMGGVTETWGVFTQCWASRRDTSGRERVQAGAETAMADAVFRLRYISGVTAKMRVLEGDDAWDIVGIGEMGRREGLELTCTRVRA